MVTAGRGSGQPYQATIILPTLNERVGLARTLDELPLSDLLLAGFLTRVLVVDGGSTDGTVDVAREHRATVLRQTGRGKGDAVRQGLTVALEQGADFVTVIDADYSYVAETLLPAFSLLSAGTDLVIGVRRPLYDPAETARAIVHRVGDALLSLTAARLSHMPFLDICSGLWGVRSDAVRQIQLESDGFEIEAELFLKMARKGFRVSQVPVTYRPRIGMAKLRALRDGSRIFLTILRYSRVPILGRTSVNLRFLPDEDSHPGLKPSQDWIRRVQALCFSVDPPRLSIVADLEREAEARELANRLWAGNIRVDLTVSPAVPASSAAPGGGVPDSTPMIRLPALGDLPSRPAVAIVRVPQSHQLLYVPPGADPSEEDAIANRSGGYRFRRSRDSPTSFVTNLAAAVHGSAQARSQALLYATAGNLGVRSGPPVRESKVPHIEPATAPPLANEA